MASMPSLSDILDMCDIDLTQYDFMKDPETSNTSGDIEEIDRSLFKHLEAREIVGEILNKVVDDVVYRECIKDKVKKVTKPDSVDKDKESSKPGVSSDLPSNSKIAASVSSDGQLIFTFNVEKPSQPFSLNEVSFTREHMLQGPRIVLLLCFFCFLLFLFSILQSQQNYVLLHLYLYHFEVSTRVLSVMV